MAVVEAKAKVQRRHETAIKEFQKWKRSHPKATKKERYEMFDFLVDTGRRVDG